MWRSLSVYTAAILTSGKHLICLWLQRIFLVHILKFWGIEELISPRSRYVLANAMLILISSGA
jgi:hypothetical protein